EFLVAAIEKVEGDTDKVEQLKRLLNSALIPLDLKEELVNISKALRDKPSQISAAEIDKYLETIRIISSILEGYNNRQVDLTLFTREILLEKMRSIQSEFLKVRAFAMTP